MTLAQILVGWLNLAVFMLAIHHYARTGSFLPSEDAQPPENTRRPSYTRP